MAQTPLLPTARRADAPGAARRRIPTAASKQKPQDAKKPPPKQDTETATPSAEGDRHRPPPALEDPNVDLAYGAYQRGQYKTAFDIATNARS